MFDPSRTPDRRTVAEHLGDATSLWDAIINSARKRVPLLVETWHFAGPKVGWSLRLMDRSRILVYLTPEAGRFRVGLVLGSKAVAVARSAGLSTAASVVVDSAPRYAEGYGVRFHVASNGDMAPVEELLGIKLSAAPKAARRSKRP